MKASSAIPTLIFLLVVATALTSDNKIKTDGILSPGERDNTKAHDLGNGNTLFTKTNGAVLYVALAGSASFWAHVYLSDGERIQVMHASAALGAIEYKREKTLWHTQDNFRYEMRDRVYNNEVEARMNEYFTKNGWVANNNNLGDRKTIEYRLDLTKWKTPVYFACVLANNDMSLYHFPSDLKDDTALAKLVQGYAVDSLRFEPASWETINR
jgi:hypothetical protein